MGIPFIKSVLRETKIKEMGGPGHQGHEDLREKEFRESDELEDQTMRIPKKRAGYNHLSTQSIILKRKEKNVRHEREPL